MQQLLSSLDLNGKIKSIFELGNDDFIFLNRMPIVAASESDFDEDDPSLPKIKMGAVVGDGMRQRLNQENPDRELINLWSNRLADNLVTGVKTRMNVMLCDALTSYSYENINPISLSVSDLLKKKVSNEKIGPWTNPATATPIADINAVNERFHKQYDRLTLSTPIKDLIVATDEFKQFAETQGKALSDVDILSKALKMIVEVYDATYWVRSNSGEAVVQRVLPEESMILSRTKDDNNELVFDFAVTPVTETNDPIIGQNYQGAPQPSPVGYFREDEGKVAGWAVVRGVPRIHDETCAVSLTVKS